MTPLSDALTAAQRHAIATLEKAYVAGLIEPEALASAMEACGITDAVDRAFLLASLDVLREWGVAAPTMTERVARENGEPKKATEGQVKYALDLLGRGDYSLGESEVRCLTFEQASKLIDSLKSGSYQASEWEVPF